MKAIALEEHVYAELVLALQRADVQPTIPPEVKPVEPEPVKPIETKPIALDVLMGYLATRQDLAREYGHVVEFSIKRPDLQDPEKVVEAYLASVSHITPPAAVDVMYNAGTGFPIADIKPADAFFLFREGQKAGKKLYYPVLQGLQSQIGALINWVEAGENIVPAQAFDTETYSGPVRPYVERFLATGSLTR
jgi:hypothetical protein